MIPEEPSPVSRLLRRTICPQIPAVDPGSPVVFPSGPPTGPGISALDPASPRLDPAGKGVQISGPHPYPSGPAFRPEGKTARPSSPATYPAGPDLGPKGKTVGNAGKMTEETCAAAQASSTVSPLRMRIWEKRAFPDQQPIE